ncbi:hypothetical protein BH11ARM1_BH11ARM1_05890 [soil metagenome]
MANYEKVIVEIKAQSPTGIDLLPDVLRQLNALVRLLADFSDRNSKVEVVEISKNSPLRAELRVVSFHDRPKVPNAAPSRPIVRRTSQPFRRLEKAYREVVDTSPPKKVDAPGLVALQDFAKLLRHDVATIDTSHAHMVMDSSLIERAQQRLGVVRRSRGSLTGILEGLNVHTKPWSFTIYPEVGPNRVKCTFEEKQFAEVQHAIRKVVTVHGLKDYAGDSPWPLRMVADRIDIRQEAKPGSWLTLVDNLEAIWDQADEDERLIVIEGLG